MAEEIKHNKGDLFARGAIAIGETTSQWSVHWTEEGCDRIWGGHHPKPYKFVTIEDPTLAAEVRAFNHRQDTLTPATLQGDPFMTEEAFLRHEQTIKAALQEQGLI